MAKSTKDNALNHCVGSSNTSMRMRESSQNSQAFAVTGISSTYFGRIQNFRLHTLGVPVSNSDSGEASQNSLMPRSSKLELRFFFYRDVCI